MTLHCPENLRRVLDQIVTKPKLEPAMVAIGASPKLIWTWLRRSAGGDPAFIVHDWPSPGDPPMPFHEAVAMARKQSVVIFESILRDECMRGIPRIVLEKGEVVYQKNPAFLDWTPEDFRNLGVDPRERYVLDPVTKLPKPLVVYDPAPAHLRIRAAAAMMPAWREHKNVNLEQRVSGGVMVIGASAPGPLTAQSRPIDGEFTEALPIAAIAAPEMVPEAPEELDGEPDADAEWTPTSAPALPPAPPRRSLDYDHYGRGDPGKGGYRVCGG